MSRRRLALVAFALTASLLAACSRPIRTARMTRAELPAPEELDATWRDANSRCSPGLAFLFPGLGQFCARKDTEAQILAGLATVELGTAIYAATQVEVAPGDSVLAHPAVALPATAIQDLYVYGIADTVIQRNLAAAEPLTPRDSLLDLAAAPFNIQVMREPKVFAGIIGMLAIGVGVTLAISEVDSSEAGADPNVFGRTFGKPLGYGLGAATFGGFFTHVATAEEAMFRGVVQSGLARSQGEWEGFLYGSLIFGAIHAPNALAFEGDERRDYLLYALPTITLVGGYLSYLYKDFEYSLAPSVAAHFWYDFGLSAIAFIVAPNDSPISARLGWSF